MLPTGAGKSLCYILPAIALPGLTVVVSPLIALMQDQLRKLPVQCPGACLSGSLSAQQVAEISEAVLRGRLKVLFLSPERLCTPSFRRLISLLHQQHQYRRCHPGSGGDCGGSGAASSSAISLLCVDEAHCLSQWSYNFRPAFLRIRREVHFLQPAAVLALTATATPYIQRDIMRHLNISSASSSSSSAPTAATCGIPAQVPGDEGLLALPARRDNLVLAAQLVRDEQERRQRILQLLKEPANTISSYYDNDDVGPNQEQEHELGDDDEDALGNEDDIIDNGTNVAVSRSSLRKRAAPSRSAFSVSAGPRRKKVKEVAPLSIVYVWRRDEADALAQYLKGSGVDGVAVYHAGLDAGQRQRTQRMFDRGAARCVVATVAFGMGVDKADVRQVRGVIVSGWVIVTQPRIHFSHRFCLLSLFRLSLLHFSAEALLLYLLYSATYCLI